MWDKISYFKHVRVSRVILSVYGLAFKRIFPWNENVKDEPTTVNKMDVKLKSSRTTAKHVTIRSHSPQLWQHWNFMSSTKTTSLRIEHWTHFFAHWKNHAAKSNAFITEDFTSSTVFTRTFTSHYHLFLPCEKSIVSKLWSQKRVRRILAPKLQTYKVGRRSLLLNETIFRIKCTKPVLFFYLWTYKNIRT